jgi:hypothetical protein
MHASLYVMFDKKYAKTSEEARRFVFNWLDSQGFVGNEGRFSSGIADWCVIGGRWSGEFTKKSLDDVKIDEFEKKFEEKHGFWTNRDTSDEMRRKQAEKMFAEFFPDFDGNVPYWRDTYKTYGYEDDAVIVDKEIYEKIIKEGVKKDISNGGAVIDTDEYDTTTLSKKDIIGKKCIVVVDFHS